MGPILDKEKFQNIHNFHFMLEFISVGFEQQVLIMTAKCLKINFKLQDCCNVVFETFPYVSCCALIVAQLLLS